MPINNRGDNYIKNTVKLNLNKLKDKLLIMDQRLTEEIKKDVSQFVPYRSGELDKSAYIRNLGDKKKEIVWHTPYARVQFYGRVMRDEKGRAWVGKGEKKTYPTNKIMYSKDIHPNATSFWTSEAKRKYMKKWAEKAKEYLRD